MTSTTSAHLFQASLDRFNALDTKDRSALLFGISSTTFYICTAMRSSEEIMAKIKSVFPQNTDPEFALDLVSLAIKGHDFSKS